MLENLTTFGCSTIRTFDDEIEKRKMKDDDEKNSESRTIKAVSIVMILVISDVLPAKIIFR